MTPQIRSDLGTFRRFAAVAIWGEPDMQMVVLGDHIGADDPSRTSAGLKSRRAAIFCRIDSEQFRPAPMTG